MKLSFLNLWLSPFVPQIRIAKLEALLYNKGKLIWFAVPCVLLFMREVRGGVYFLLYMIYYLLLDGLNNGSETSSSAMKDLQSKLDTVSAECLTEKEKVINPFCFKLSPSYNC